LECGEKPLELGRREGKNVIAIAGYPLPEAGCREAEKARLTDLRWDMRGRAER